MSEWRTGLGASEYSGQFAQAQGTVALGVDVRVASAPFRKLVQYLRQLCRDKGVRVIMRVDGLWCEGEGYNG